MHRHTGVAGSQATVPIQERLQTSTSPHLCHLQQEGIHNVAWRARGVQAPPVPLHLLHGEGGHDVHVAEELGLGAWEALQEPGEHLIGLWGEGQLFPWGLALHPGGGAGGWVLWGLPGRGRQECLGKVVEEESHRLPGPKGS